MYPRYNATDAMLRAVERIAPGEAATLERMRTRLVEAGQTAESPFTRSRGDPVEERAVAEEREAFVAFVSTLPQERLTEVAPLPLRRELLREERDAVLDLLRTRWGIDPAGYWWPLVESDRTDLLALQAPFFDRAVPPSLLQSIVAERDSGLVWEVREDGTVREIGLELLEPAYDGDEGYWFSPGSDWILYASHESSLTVGGAWLIGRVQELWPEWRAHVWTTPFF